MFKEGLLKGKRILVTGGGTGLGREMAAKYLELGADLCICGRRREPLANTDAELTAKHGGTGKCHTVDIRGRGARACVCAGGGRGEPLEKAAAELTAKHGGTVKCHTVDIRDAAAVDAMVQVIWEDGGPLTGLVNNAAGNFISRTEDLSPRGFDAIANTVFHGTFYVTHAVGKRWIAGGHKGSVISIGVTWVWKGSPFLLPSA